MRLTDRQVPLATAAGFRRFDPISAPGASGRYRRLPLGRTATRAPRPRTRGDGTIYLDDK